MRLFILLIALCSSIFPAHAAKTILIMGDSLSAGYGIRSDQAWPALLGKRLSATHPDYNVVNLSISGETTAGGRSRLPEALRIHQPAIVILALGANDGLRGLPINQMRGNLSAMSEAARRSGARLLIAGMRLPPNYGPYAEQFFKTFDEVARGQKSALLPFLLEPIATRPELFQPDQLHPTADAQPLILDHVWPGLKPLLK